MGWIISSIEIIVDDGIEYSRGWDSNLLDNINTKLNKRVMFPLILNWWIKEDALVVREEGIILLQLVDDFFLWN